MAKKHRSIMEEELEEYSKPKPQILNDAAKRILTIVKDHAKSITRTKMQHLNDGEGDQYAIYANIEAAYDILLDDLRKEGFLNA